MPALRASRRWTQQELADRLGVSRQTIISIEANRYNPSLILAFEIARLFEVDINQVFQYEIREELS
nr:helix-turn-helix transcriptional regulator [Brevibacillus sp. SYP-B805]